MIELSCTERAYYNLHSNEVLEEVLPWNSYVCVTKKINTLTK